ncbi:MAG: dTDP-glucose 4,6-dehydratase [Pelotomaculum sp. PtaU1.Bin065]|nr:MAG: dTDP-glucose 4,6-dehydratase [Pelotomaculum sp. PtaU1.Bin065]
MDLTNKKVLVIGGAGLIGSHVVEELLKEPVREVVIYDNFTRGVLDNLTDALKDSRCKIFELGGDICQTDLLDKAVEGCDAVVHLAALWLLHCHEFPQSAFEVNIRGTFNVLQACVKHNVKRLVYSSSASVYGDALEEPMTESHPYNNWTFYGATKIAGEHMMKAFYNRYGLEGVGLRYMNVYGPRQDYKGTYIAVMMKILDCIDRGERPVVFGDGSQAYDFIYVQDCARSNVCALKADIPHGFYNVGRGIKTSIKQLAELLLELTSSDLEIQYEPAGQTFVTNRVGCPKAAEHDLGFKWTIDLREGMQKLIDWRKNHKEAVETRRIKAGL